MSVRLTAALLISCLWGAMSCAADNYADHPAALALVDEMVREQGFDRQQLLQVFAQARRQERILEAIARPAEKTKPWYEYREIFLNRKREAQGLEFYARHRDTLLRAERETGVPAEIIVAIIGVETYYGRVAGSYRVIDALSTLAFDYPRRSDFFTGELRSYLLLTRDQGFDPLLLKGSYAGAMGYGQFMPSSFLAYAVDFDGDGIVDIWNNPVDAIGSVANYFKRHGWRAGETVVVAADVRGDVPAEWFVRSRSDLVPEHTVAAFIEAGVVPRQPVDPQALAIAMDFELERGVEYWLGLHNFYVITRYNHSAMYAMSVYQLSRRLAEGMAVQ
ncbi:MAG: lytic murein transglycosylase B [Halioglobus sp.]|nr:lytic murein transglycosylase B [Halioglobus sp.]